MSEENTASQDHYANPEWQPMRGPFSRWPRLSDTALAVAMLLITIGFWMSWVSDDPEARAADAAPAVALVLFVIGNAALLWRRRKPLHVHFTVLGVSALAMAVIPMFGPIPALMVTLYSVGRYAVDYRWSLAGMGSGVFLVIIDELFGPEAAGGSIISVILAFLTWYIGRRIRLRGEYLDLLKDRAEQLERQQAVEAERAVAEERTRIARELHDIVAHQVSLMTVQAGAAKTVASDNPEAALQAMESVEKAGRQALNELRHLVGVLRPGQESQGLGPQPGSTHIPRLVDEIRAAGLEVSLDIDLATLSMPARVDLAVYRIVQEALTNVLKHAGPGTSVGVSISNDARSVAIEVTDGGGGTTRLPGSGQGIAGMRERAHSLGGSLVASPVAGGGFKVVACLPLDGDLA